MNSKKKRQKKNKSDKKEVSPIFASVLAVLGIVFSSYVVEAVLINSVLEDSMKNSIIGSSGIKALILLLLLLLAIRALTLFRSEYSITSSNNIRRVSESKGKHATKGSTKINPGLSVPKVLTAVFAGLIVLQGTRDAFSESEHGGIMGSSTRAFPGLGVFLMILFALILWQLYLHNTKSFKNPDLINALYYGSVLTTVGFSLAVGFVSSI